MKECSKSIQRRLRDPKFISHYFVGDGLDIGGKPDPLALYTEVFCRMGDVRTWDLEDGDAQLLESVAEESYDFVHSSHCLEHLHDPVEGLRNWFRVLRQGGHLIVTVPDEDLYEQGVFPSTFNSDHKWTFTLWKDQSWSPCSMNILDLVVCLGPAAQPVRLEVLDSGYRFNLPRYDQTLTPVAESGIEFVVRKRSVSEVSAGGLLPGRQKVSPLMRVHLNQYRDDMTTLKHFCEERPPFQNDTDL